MLFRSLIQAGKNTVSGVSGYTRLPEDIRDPPGPCADERAAAVHDQFDPFFGAQKQQQQADRDQGSSDDQEGTSSFHKSILIQK